MRLSTGQFKGRLSSFIFRRLAVHRQLTAFRTTSTALILLLMFLGVALIVHAGVSELKPFGVSDDFFNGIGGALLGSAVSLIAFRALSLNDELIGIVASGAMSKSSVDPQHISAFQKKWIMLHTTRMQRGVIDLTRGFTWVQALVDLTAPSPGKLLGTYTTRNPLIGKDMTYIVEGYLRHGILVLHVFPEVGLEDIEATFVFPFVQSPEYLAYGTGYHMTYAGKTDLVQSPAILCPSEKIDLLPKGKHGCCLTNGLVDDEEARWALDNVWWNNHRVKTLPRILTQISTTYANVGNIDGSWRFRYLLVYEDSGEPVDRVMKVRKAGARYLAEPDLAASCSASGEGGSADWMAELRPIHPFSMVGRWWGLPLSYRNGISGGPEGRRGAGSYSGTGESCALLSTEGTLVLNVEVNDLGLYGMFFGRPGVVAREFAVIAAVRDDPSDEEGTRARLTRRFDQACGQLRRPESRRL